MESYKCEHGSNSLEKPQQNESESIMTLIEQYDINCISLLNEISSKVGKDASYTFSDVKEGTIPLFSCECSYDEEIIGTGKKNSKQGAKLNAATDAIKSFLTSEKYSLEKAHLLLSIKKVVANLSSSNQDPIIVKNINMTKINTQDDKEGPEILNEGGSLVNDSAIYELNLLSKEFLIEPSWKTSVSAGSSGEFVAEVNFDGIICSGFGKKKLEAKRDAALKVIEKIRNNRELSAKFYRKHHKEEIIKKDQVVEKYHSDEIIQKISNNDERKLMFRNLLQNKVVKEIQKECQRWKKDATLLHGDFNQYLTELLQKQKLPDEVKDFLNGFFYRLVDYTNSLTTTNVSDAFKSSKLNLQDYVTECSIVPVGSFALDCMRRNQLTIDAIISYHEKKKISEKEFLSIFKELLEDHQNSLGDNLPNEARMSFKLDFSDVGDHLLVTLNFPFGALTIEIQAHNMSKENEEKLSKSLCHYSVAHVQSIYEYFGEDQDLNKFRSLMGLMRIWRKNCNAKLLHPELIDAVLLSEIFNAPNADLAYYVKNFLMVMSSEQTLKIALDKFESFYQKIFQELPEKLKWSLFTRNLQSLEAIHQRKYQEAYLY